MLENIFYINLEHRTDRKKHVENELKKMGKEKGKIQFVCKAVDSSYNQQPENVHTLWNLRGILNNSWHRVDVKVVED